MRPYRVVVLSPVFDEQRLHADPAEPGSDDFGRELRTVIGTDVIRRSSIREQIGQEMENVVGPEPPGPPGWPNTPGCIYR